MAVATPKFDFGWSFAPPRPVGGAYSVPQSPCWDLSGLILSRSRGKAGNGKV